MKFRAQGFALVNALVIVMAISSVAVGLLLLAAKGRARIGDTIVTNQLVLYLDGIQALIPVFLEQEWERNGSDHLGEFWASKGYSVPIDRGVAEATLTDQQGLLDVNRLTNPDDATKAEFARLFDILGLRQSLLNTTIDFLSDRGPSQVTGYLDRPVPILPTGGPINIIEELRQIEGFDDAAFSRLAPFISALPEFAPLNANTAPAEVLRAVIPLLRSDHIAALIRERTREPFKTNLDFFVRAERLLGESALQAQSLDRFTVRTSHFAAQLIAHLEGRQLVRNVLFVRDETNGGKTTAKFAYAVTVPVPPS